MSAASESKAGATEAPASGGDRRDRRPELRIDTHTHILPETWPDLKDRYGYGGFIKLEHHMPCRAKMLKDDGTFFREIEDNCWSPVRRLADCDKVGIDVHVLSTVPVMFSYWAKPEDTLDLSRLLNDHISDTVKTNPVRFVGLGTLPMNDPALALDELKRCTGELGLKGFEIATHINDKTLDDPSFFPVFKACADAGACLFVHPWDMIGAGLMKKYWLPWLVAMPAETSMAICSMMFSGLLERLPHLRVCFAHGGGSFPGTVARVQHGFDVRPDLCAIDTKRPPSEWGGSFWADSLTHDATQLDAIVKCFGEDKICLGSDYPFPLGEYTAESMGKDYCAGALIDSMSHWSPELKTKVCGTNACAWLGMEETDFRKM